VPGDRIVGILTKGEGVTIYPIQSPALAVFDNDPESWIDVRWDVEPGEERRFPSRLALQSINEPGASRPSPRSSPTTTATSRTSP
jgi:GTP pyrophosphokinase